MAKLAWGRIAKSTGNLFALFSLASMSVMSGCELCIYMRCEETERRTGDSPLRPVPIPALHTVESEHTDHDILAVRRLKWLYRG